ncbi:hypothetical protein BX666DRAFT_1977071 [Dichotomocladium elegans]|nr:hypothetical protein BX666DRAFT_1977071 [Dichotomocladium elegans]
MDLITEFQSRSIPNACSYLLEFCNFALASAGTPSVEHTKAFYSALPNILTTIFGAPSTKGWLQMETTADQDTAIKQLLRADGPFFQGILSLGKHQEYSYNVATESLPEDVQRVLATGGTQHLPRLYTGSVYLEERACTGKKDIRMAATQKSVIFPRPVSGEYRIKFNMVQFFLYYLISVPTWKPLTSPSIQQPSQMTQIRNHHVPHGLNLLHRSNTTVQPQAARNQQPHVRSIIQSAYNDVIQEYLRQLIPCVARSGQQDFVPRVSTFFLDAIVELWLRTPWIAMGQKLSAELMHYITLFVQYVVSGDLRRQGQQQSSIDTQYKMVYDSVREELYFLLSRLALNWSTEEGYLQVMNIWAVWAAPWRFGATPHSLEVNEYRPLAGGWSNVILDNALFYIPIVEIFLRRIATFTYAEPIPQLPTLNPLQGPPQSVPPVQQPQQPDKKIGKQLQIIYRLINVLKEEGLREYLSLIEQAISAIHSESMRTNATLTRAPMPVSIETIAVRYFGNQKGIVRERLKKTYDELLQLGDGAWNPPNIYTTGAGPRTAALSTILEAIHQASVARRRPPGIHVTAASQAQRQGQEFEELSKVAMKFSDIFSLSPGTGDITTNTQGESSSFFSTLQNRKREPKRSAPAEPISLAGLIGTGYLSEEERKAVREGKMQCSSRNIPALGPRAEEVVRSYEVRFMVYVDLWVNQKVKSSHSIFLNTQFPIHLIIIILFVPCSTGNGDRKVSGYFQRDCRSDHWRRRST